MDVHERAWSSRNIFLKTSGIVWVVVISLLLPLPLLSNERKNHESRGNRFLWITTIHRRNQLNHFISYQ